MPPLMTLGFDKPTKYISVGITTLTRLKKHKKYRPIMRLCDPGSHACLHACCVQGPGVRERAAHSPPPACACWLEPHEKQLQKSAVRTAAAQLWGVPNVWIRCAALAGYSSGLPPFHCSLDGALRGRGKKRRMSEREISIRLVPAGVCI